MTTFIRTEQCLDDFLSAFRCNGECWCGVHGTAKAKRVRIPSHVVIPRGILSPILSPFEIGVNAERTTSSQPEPRGAGNSSGVNTVLEPSFQILSPLLIFVGVNACEDYISSVNRAIRRQVGCAFGVTPNMSLPNYLSLPWRRVRRMPVELHAFKHEVPGSNPGGFKVTDRFNRSCRLLGQSSTDGIKLKQFITQTLPPALFVAHPP